MSNGIPNKNLLLASVEQSGNTEGNFAQLEPIVLRDLQEVKGLFKDVKFSDVQKNPKLYQQVVDAYWKRLDDFGIKNSMDKAIWWLMPGRFRQTGGDINKLENPRFRNIMQNRVNNLSQHLGFSPFTEGIREELQNGRNTN